MAVMRILSLCMLLCCSEAMFKKDMRSVMEEEWPDMSSINNAVSKAQDAVAKAAKKAGNIVHQGQEAVDNIKDLALDTFEAAAAKVNESLKVVGQEVRDLNGTAMKEIINLDEKVKAAEDKAAVFAAGTSNVLEKVQALFDQFVEQLRSVTKMASDVLRGVNQEKAVLSLEKAMDSVYATASSWNSSLMDLDRQLQMVTQRLHPSAPVVSTSNTSNATNSLTSEQLRLHSPCARTQAADLLQLNPSDPITLEEISKTLKAPMGQLKSAAAKLNDMAQDVTGAMGKFVDGTLEAAKQKIPKSLMANITEVLKGVQDEATQELAPLGDVGKSIVGGIYQAGTDAGLDFGSFGFRSAQPFTLLMAFVLALGCQ